MDIKYLLKIFIFVFLILSLIAFINTLGLNLNEETKEKKLLQVVTIEALATGSTAFCDSHKGASGSLETSCGKLTRNNCNDTSCCVWTSNNKCVAGSADGPTFNTSKNKQLDYYYFSGKCYGSGCPKVS